VPADRFVLEYAVTSASSTAMELKTTPPSVERSTRNPVSSVALSVQLRSI
jgi:hypothetical protein